MSSIMVFCPTTASAVYTGIEMDETTFTKLPDVVSRMSCSACGAVHLWTTRKAWWLMRGGKLRTNGLVLLCR
jgi:hypothetical protein